MEHKENHEHFTVLENKNIGSNLALFRKLRNKKALEVADYLGIGEAAYTKYERGESRITVDIIQKVSEVLDVDPVALITTQPGTLVTNGVCANGSRGNNSNSPYSSNLGYFHYHGADQELLQSVIKVMEQVVAMNQRFMDYIKEKDK